MGKNVQDTKPRNGYVVKKDGSRLEGMLQLSKVEGVLSVFKLKIVSGKKLKIPFSQVSNYGLLLTIDELTKSGAKEYKDEARNFHLGIVNLSNGPQKEGLIAFKEKVYINPKNTSLGYKYVGLFFAANREDVIKSIPFEDIVSVNHNSIVYSPYEGGFVTENSMKNDKFANKLKRFNEGVLTLKDGTTINGHIALVNKGSANYKSREGVITLYKSDKIKRFDVTVDVEKKAVVNVDDKLTEEFYLGKTFWAYDNPTPTTINWKKTNLVRNGVSLTTSATSSLIISHDEKKLGYESDLDSLIMSSTTEELKQYRDALLLVQGYETSEELQEKCTIVTVKKYDFALNFAIAGREAREKIILYYNEVILKNLKTNETLLLYQDKKYLKGHLEGLMMGCYTYLMLEKKEQKKYYDLNIIGETAQMLDECY